MKFSFSFLKIIFVLCGFNVAIAVAQNTNHPVPALLLANSYHSGIELQSYWVSEKLDGVRAFWNGEKFISRQGNIFHAPVWFTRALPKTELDGELWLGRGEFDQLSGVVRRDVPDEADWRKIKFMIFELPNHAGSFDQRLKRLQQIVAEINAPHIQLVAQFKVASHEALNKKLDELVAQGAEGLMLHLGSSLYKSGRSDDLLKLKKYSDAEAVVIAHIPGKGKYTGMLGSLLVETPDKRRFKIGTGFSDAERKNPPAIGATITYKYFALTGKGTPRFVSFMRVRNNY